MLITELQKPKYINDGIADFGCGESEEPQKYLPTMDACLFVTSFKRSLMLCECVRCYFVRGCAGLDWAAKSLLRLSWTA